MKMINRRDDTPKARGGDQGSGVGESDSATFPLDEKAKRTIEDASDARLPVELPFGVGTDAPVEDLPVPGDSHSKHSYYYDDATNYKVFNPDDED